MIPWNFTHRDECRYHFIIMHMSAGQRRAASLALIGIGMLPSIAAGGLMMAFLIAPSIFRAAMDSFLPVGVDAPDNWAIAAMRLIWLCIYSGLAGGLAMCGGLWIRHHMARWH